jgi:hypothetical protein
MARVKIGPALPDRQHVHVEVARLRDLDTAALQSRYRTVVVDQRPVCTENLERIPVM